MGLVENIRNIIYHMNNVPDKLVLVWNASEVVSPILVMFVFSFVNFFLCESVHHNLKRFHFLSLRYG